MKITRISAWPLYTHRLELEVCPLDGEQNDWWGLFMIQRQLALLFSAVFFISLSLNGCSSSSEPTEPELTDDGPQEPEQVSFADWERPENCELGTMPVIGEA